jgi:hypothetical protein
MTDLIAHLTARLANSKGHVKPEDATMIADIKRIYDEQIYKDSCERSVDPKSLTGARDCLGNPLKEGDVIYYAARENHPEDIATIVWSDRLSAFSVHFESASIFAGDWLLCSLETKFVYLKDETKKEETL